MFDKGFYDDRNAVSTLIGAATGADIVQVFSKVLKDSKGGNIDSGGSTASGRAEG